MHYIIYKTNKRESMNQCTDTGGDCGWNEGEEEGEFTKEEL